MSHNDKKWREGELVTDYIDENTGFDAQEFHIDQQTATVPVSLLKQLGKQRFLNGFLAGVVLCIAIIFVLYAMYSVGRVM